MSAPARRGTAARIGVTALNLIAPGLGLLRIGDGRRGWLFLPAPFALLPLLAVGAGRLPITGYRHALAALAAVLALAALLYVAPFWLTWRGSRYRNPSHSWSRWYALVAVALLSLGLTRGAASLAHRFYKPFFIPSESMAPTLEAGDGIVADMRWRGPVRPGAIILFRANGEVRLSRVAAVAGDRIAMRGGVPVVNGRSAARRIVGRVPRAEGDAAALLVERLPGEAASHRVLEDGDSPVVDDVADTVVPAGHLYVLGDNRDRSADSRVPPDHNGVGMVPASAIIGRPLYIHWSANRARIGARLDR